MTLHVEHDQDKQRFLIWNEAKDFLLDLVSYNHLRTKSEAEAVVEGIHRGYGLRRDI